MIKFEEKLDEINKLISLKRGKWSLNRMGDMDYDDICQHVRIHIYKKWDKWNQDLKFAPWASTVIDNQIRNLMRDKFYNFAPPCLNCPKNQGGNLCSYTESGFQDTSCPLYAKWYKSKRFKRDVNLPISMEEIDDGLSCQFVEPEVSDQELEDIHELVMFNLNDHLSHVYELLYVKELSDEDAARELGISPDRKRKDRFKQLENLKAQVKKESMRILKREDIV